MAQTLSYEYSNMTFASRDKHTESASSMQARKYMPSETSKSAISACIKQIKPMKNIKALAFNFFQIIKALHLELLQKHG